MRSPRTAANLVPVLVLVAGLLFSGLVASGGLGSGASPRAPTLSAAAVPVHGAAALHPAVRVLHGSEVPGVSRGAAQPLVGAHFPASATPPNFTCDPYYASMSGMYPSPLNFTVAVSPANSTVAAPANVSWNYTIFSGGLPPYQVETIVTQQSYGVQTFPTFYSGLPVGNVTITSPGVYYLDFFAYDSLCLNSGRAYLTLQVYGSLGSHPLPTPTVSVSSPSVPASVTYSVNASRIPANYSVEWTGGALLDWNGTTVTNWFYLPTSFSSTALLLDPNGVLIEEVPLAPITLGGTGPIKVTVRTAPVAGGANVSIWANITNRSALPSFFHLYLWGFSTHPAGGAWNGSTNASDSVSYELDCGPLGSTWVAHPNPSGVCYENASLVLWNSNGTVDNYEPIPVQANASGSLSQWYFAGTSSYSIVYGNHSAAVTVNFSMSGGIAPYLFQAGLAGRSSDNRTGSYYPGLNWTYNGSTFWTGSPVQIQFTLHQTGVYWFGACLWDSQAQQPCYSVNLPLIVIGLVLPPSFALNVRASIANITAAPSNVSGLTVTFALTTAGGVAPYSVEWSFGDGTYGTSSPTASLTHSYPVAGTYVAAVTVRDASGRSITLTFAPLVVSVTASTSVGPPPPVNVVPPFVAPTQPPTKPTQPSTPTTTVRPAAGPGPFAAPGVYLWVVPGIVALLAYLLVRREWRRDGEAYFARDEGPEERKGG